MSPMTVSTEDDEVCFTFTANEMAGAFVQLVKMKGDGIYRLLASDGVRDITIKFSAGTVATVICDRERPKRQS